MRLRSISSLLLALLAVVLLAAACGSDSDGGAGSLDGAVPTEPADQVAPVVVEGEPLAPMPEGVSITAAADDPAIGTIAPTLRGTNFDGSEVVVSADGTPTAVMFVAHWCPHCQREVPVVVDLIANGAKPDGFDVVIVSTAIQEGQPNYPPQDWLVEESWPGVVMRDSAEFDALLAYGAGGFPFTVYLDGANQVVARSAGELEPEVIEGLWLAAAES